jgi:hypothetical protein
MMESAEPSHTAVEEASGRPVGLAARALTATRPDYLVCSLLRGDQVLSCQAASLWSCQYAGSVCRWGSSDIAQRTNA